MNRFELSVLNEEIRWDPAEFIAQCDERYNLMVLDTATQIARNRKNSPIVLLAGPSGSGKTTTALRIRSALEARGIGSHSIQPGRLLCEPCVSRLPADRNRRAGSGIPPGAGYPAAAPAPQRPLRGPGDPGAALQFQDPRPGSGEGASPEPPAR